MLRLLEIDRTGGIAASVELDEIARSVCDATRDMYNRTGFEPPWIGYLAQWDDQLVGTCGFKGPPVGEQVEIAYFTFPPYEGRGFATRMAQQLLQVARAHRPPPTVTAQTLPEENASTSVLKKLGFARTSEVEHPEDGLVWQWTFVSPREPPTR